MLLRLQLPVDYKRKQHLSVCFNMLLWVRLECGRWREIEEVCSSQGSVRN